MSHNEIVPASELTVRPLAGEPLYPNVSSQARGSEEEGVQERGEGVEGAERAPGEDEDTEETPERARGEKAAAFVFLILHPGQRGEGSSRVATGAVHLIILVFSLLLLSTQLRGQKSNCVNSYYIRAVAWQLSM